MPLLFALAFQKKDCSQYTDTELAEMIIQGDPGRSLAIQCLIKSYQKGYSSSMMKKHSVLSWEDIEDAFSVSINELYRYIASGRYSGPAKISTLFFTIFNRRCIDIVRSVTNKGQYHGELSSDPTDPNPDAFDQLERIEKKEILAKAMEKLSIRCRNVLMDWNNGYSMKEIAEMNGLANDNTAKSTRSNCMTKLKAFIKEILE